MADGDDSPDIFEIDREAVLPRQNKWSIALVLAVAGLNAFNDNILKMMLVGLAPKVSDGPLGQDIGSLLGGIILIPYIVLAPVAGYLSDRFSKRRVILAMLFAQAVILAAAGLVLVSEPGQLGVAVALGIFFLLAVQSTLFSPAKFGIVKEVAGSRRLGMVAGWLQMVTMLGILGGLWVGGEWFDWLYSRWGNPWQAAAYPIWVLLGVSVVALIAGWKIQPVTPVGRTEFRVPMLWQHFRELAETLKVPSLRRACFGNSAYWFVASMVGAMFVDIGIALFPDAAVGGAASASSRLTLMVGLGTAGGSVFASWVNRRGLQLGLIPLGSLGMAGALLLTGWSELGSTLFEVGMVAVGFAGGCYLVPIQAFIQDRAPPERRGRVISGVNLMDSLSGILAVTLLMGIKHLGGSFAVQFTVLGVLMLGASVYIVKLLPQDLLRLVVLGIVRSIYKVKPVGADKMPAEGGVLLLPNHVSYVDALILSAASPRPLRFVIWDVLYKLWWMNGFLRFVGTVPISATRAKDAVKVVAAALKAGEVVCLFPEGQLTRHGMVNELRKGFELMARQGKAQVQPTYLDGLYGSIFSFEGGKFFFKRPKKLRYPVAVHFGDPLAPTAATTEVVRKAMFRLSSDAFDQRQPTREVANIERSAQMNALRLLDIDCLPPKGGVLVVAETDSAVIRDTAHCITMLRPEWKLASSLTGDVTTGAGAVVLVGRLNPVRELLAGREPEDASTMTLVWVASEEELKGAQALKGSFPGWMDLQTGVLIAQSVPHPKLPESEVGNQRGFAEGSLGRLLPGLSYEMDGEGVRIGWLNAGVPHEVRFESWALDKDGLIMPMSQKSLPETVSAE